MLTLQYNEPVFILMLRGRVGCLRQPTLPLSIRINTGSLYRNDVQNEKLKITQAMKAQRWRWVVNATLRPLYLG